ncbi:hypothetical protein [Dietzia sp.]|uniref:hypothetical protein n=1 Tax=Dietzia sp. TaxID=1871616 RepID=UPI002FDA5803
MVGGSRWVEDGAAVGVNLDSSGPRSRAVDGQPRSTRQDMRGELPFLSVLARELRPIRHRVLGEQRVETPSEILLEHCQARAVNSIRGGDGQRLQQVEPRVSERAVEQPEEQLVDLSAFAAGTDRTRPAR